MIVDVGESRALPSSGASSKQTNLRKTSIYKKKGKISLNQQEYRLQLPSHSYIGTVLLCKRYKCLGEDDALLISLLISFQHLA